MTSWNRGRDNEQAGEAQLNDTDPGNNVEGAARTVGGKIEQGIDNLGDTLTGKQHDLEGHDRDHGKEAAQWVEHRGDDVARTVDNAGDWADRRGSDMDSAADNAGDNGGNWADKRGNDLENAADKAGDWIKDRADDIKRKLD